MIQDLIFLNVKLNTFKQIRLWSLYIKKGTREEKVYVQQYILIDIMDGFTEPLHRCQVEDIYNYPACFLGTDI